MREKMYHSYLKNLFLKFGRDWFYTYSYLNTMEGCFIDLKTRFRDSDNEAKALLNTFVRRKLIIREKHKELKLNNRGHLYSIDIQERWRLTGKAIVELYEVFAIKIEDSDYSEAAFLTLSE